METPRRRKTDKIFPKLLGALVGATCFTIIGALFPMLMRQFRPDNTVYFKYAEVPIKVNKTVYQPCDPVIGAVVRIATVNTHGTFFRDLILVRENGSGENEINIHQDKIENSITVGQDRRNIVLDLPCTLENGTYFWKGLVVYKVKNQERTYEWNTEKFQVKNPPALEGLKEKPLLNPVTPSTEQK